MHSMLIAFPHPFHPRPFTGYPQSQKTLTFQHKAYPGFSFGDYSGFRLVDRKFVSAHTCTNYIPNLGTKLSVAINT